MSKRGIVVLSVMAVAAALAPVGGAQAEPIMVGAVGTTTTHAAGMPATTEPWRTLVRGTLNNVDLESDIPRRDVWSAFVTLAGPPPAGESLTLAWMPGDLRPEGCEPLARFTETVSTVDASNVVSIERRLPDGLSKAPSCLKVTLVSKGVLSDELVGEMIALHSSGGPRAHPAEGPVHAAVGRWTPIVLLATSHWRDSAGPVTITGTGRGVRMERVTVRRLPADWPRLVVARIRARGGADSELRLGARDDLHRGFSRHSWKVKAHEGKAQRPRPGRYASGDGSVRFRVTKDHRVVRLRVLAALCQDERTTFPGRIRLPRSGAAATVSRRGSRQFGAQLLTRRHDRIQGSFTKATHSCWESRQFLARRVR